MDFVDLSVVLSLRTKSEILNVPKPPFFSLTSDPYPSPFRRTSSIPDPTRLKPDIPSDDGNILRRLGGIKRRNGPFEDV